MAKNLRNIRELAEVVGGVAKARALLRSAGVDCIGDLYDDGSIRALRSEPKVTNIGKTHKNYCTVAETDGFGAMKAVCDAADLDIVRHVYCGMNYLTVRSEKNERRTLKVYTLELS